MGNSLKFMLLADRSADIYPRLAPTMEWDTAAAHAIAGLRISFADVNRFPDFSFQQNWKIYYPITLV